jgi:hypothetical protein
MAWAAMTHRGLLAELLMAEWQSKLGWRRLARD